MVLSSIHSILNYKFKNVEVLKEALTHPNAEVVDGITKKRVNYERLEFLGDSVLELIIVELLYKKYPEYNDGDLTKKKIGLTCGKTLVRVCKQVNLSSFVTINNVISDCNDSCLENVLEAVIGAIYIDGGYESAKNFVFHHWDEFIKSDSIVVEDTNIKSELESWTIKNQYPQPHYKLIGQQGPSHRKRFIVSLKIKPFKPITVDATSIKEAEKKAAELFLDYIKRKVPDGLQKPSCILSEKPDKTPSEYDPNIIRKQNTSEINPDIDEKNLLSKTSFVEDPKSLLQNWFKKNKLTLPQYILLNKSGPDNNPKYTVKVGTETLGYVWASASSKRNAEKKAADLLLNSIQSLENCNELHSSLPTKSDFKSKLCHWTQIFEKPFPTYKVLREIGPKQNLRFVVQGNVDCVASAFGSSSSKKGAEQEAARIILNVLVKESIH